MKTVVRKIFFNFEKEEAWLNMMAAKGLNFIDYSLARYVFVEGTPGQYIYRIELLEQSPNHPESKAYIDFMEQSGVEYMGRYWNWVYFRKNAKDGPFDLYTDYDSRIKHYARIIRLVGIVWLLNLVAAILNLSIGLDQGQEVGHFFNAYISAINWIMAIVIIPVLIAYVKKFRRMKQEKDIYE